MNEDSLHDARYACDASDYGVIRQATEIDIEFV